MSDVCVSRRVQHTLADSSSEGCTKAFSERSKSHDMEFEVRFFVDARTAVKKGYAMSTSIGNTFPAELDSLLDALKGGVTSIPPDRAVQVIDSWSSKLSGTGSPELGSIARDLDQLKSGLTSGNLAGVNSLLSGIGSKVSAISASDSSGKLSQLGEALSAGAAPSGDPSI